MIFYDFDILVLKIFKNNYFLFFIKKSLEKTPSSQCQIMLKIADTKKASIKLLNTVASAYVILTLQFWPR